MEPDTTRNPAMPGAQTTAPVNINEAAGYIRDALGILHDGESLSVRRRREIALEALRRLLAIEELARLGEEGSTARDMAARLPPLDPQL